MKFYSGLPETRCGIGATVANTESIRKELPKLFLGLGIRSLVDAPCGDFNWLSTVSMEQIDYTGCDIDPVNIKIARGRDTNARSAKFLVADIRNDRLPSVDLMLCREFLQHLPNRQVHDVLANYYYSRIPFLLATCHTNKENDDLPKPGGFRPLNLALSPFNLPPPVRVIEDGDHLLALWQRDQLFAY